MTSGRLKEPCELTPQQFSDILAQYKEGASDAEAKAYIYHVRGSFSNDLWDRWLLEEEIFSEALFK